MFGDLKWGVESGGRLTEAERALFLENLAQGRAPARRAAVARSHRRLRDLDPEAVDFPVSPLARAAAALVIRAYSPALVHHCFRTYLWGLLLARADGRPVADEEALFAAALLHGLGVTDSYRGTQKGIACFAVEGALAAAQWLGRQGCSSGREQAIADAIAQQVNPDPAFLEGETARYLQAGVFCDLLGWRGEEIPEALATEILALNPSAGIEAEFARLAEREYRERPASRLGLLVEAAGGRLPALCPWRRLEARPAPAPANTREAALEACPS